MIHYEEIEPYLIDFLQGEVAEEVEYRIRAYLQQNPDFQQELDELEETLEFSHHIPLAQPAPELKMNFYAMLNEQKAMQTSVRPSFRERMKLFLHTQFYWQTLSVGVFSILLLITGYWGLSVFQERFRTTSVALHQLEFEQTSKSTTQYLDIQMPKRREPSVAKKPIENAATQGRDADDNLLDIVATTSDIKEEAKEGETKAIISQEGAYSFVNKEGDGIITVNNPNGNINLMGYAGEEVKVETSPAQSYAGIVDNNHIIIDGLANAPQINMQVLLPQNRHLQVAVDAKQNITMDLRNVQLQSNSSLTSRMGDVEVLASETTSLEINATARVIENDFEQNKLPLAYDTQMANNASANYKRSEPEKKDVQKNADLMEKEKIRTPTKKAKEMKKDENIARSKNIEIAHEDMDIATEKINSAPTSPTNPPVSKQTKISLNKGKNILKINSLSGKAKIKKKY